MLNLKSWRWSRLAEPSALKRVITHCNYILLVMLLVVLSLPMVFHGYSSTEILTSWTFWSYISAGFLLSSLATICTADKYFEIQSCGKTNQRIYLYNSGIYFPSDTTKMTIISKISGEEFIAEQKITDYDYWENETFRCFLFAIDKLYYYLSPAYEEPVQLGKTKTKTSFVTDDPSKIKILDNNAILTLQTSFASWGNVYIPPVAKFGLGRSPKPQEYLIVRTEKRYSVYGLYENRPACISLHIPVVIFKEAGQDVVLLGDENGYHEVYRTKLSVKRSINNVFVELDSKSTDVRGTVKRFNEETKEFELLYKGRFFAIDFESGAIHGENGYEYNPA